MSIVLLWKACRVASGEGDGWGRERRSEVTRGRRTDTVEGSGGRLRGDRKGEVRVWRRRVWCVKWFVRATCAVASLFSGVSLRHETRVIDVG